MGLYRDALLAFIERRRGGRCWLFWENKTLGIREMDSEWFVSIGVPSTAQALALEQP